MKLFSAAQIKEGDQYTIQSYGMRSWELMERAASTVVHWLQTNMPADSLYMVLCGTGNNGGDGLAITRLLHAKGYAVKAFLLQWHDTLSEDCNTNYLLLKNLGNDLVTLVPKDTFIADIAPHIIIIDALLGTGLNRPTEGWLAQFVEHINALPNKKIAIDIPSGLSADSLPHANDTILHAAVTLSFQFYKQSFLHPESAPYVGQLQLLDIGIHPRFIHDTPTRHYITDIATIRSCFRKRNPFGHKGSFGHALLVGGSYGMMGAITLAAKACLRSGVGKVTVRIPSVGYTIMQSQVAEAMCQTSGDNFITSIENNIAAEAVGIGPGMGTATATVATLEQFIENETRPFVLDADAINILSQKKELLHKLPPLSILTPHPKEFDRLFGKSNDSLQRLEIARTQAMLYNLVLVLKGHHTVIVTQEGICHYNTTGNAGMATAGSGDVLTGIITGLLAQGYEPVIAALLGVYLHGLAGDIAATSHSQEALIASDIIECIGKAYQFIQTGR